MVAPNGESGVQEVPKAVHSSGFLIPISTSPLMQGESISHLLLSKRKRVLASNAE